MGRIHRVGQTRDVELYNLIATDTREGEVLEVLLGNFVTAANQLEGRMFDSLSLVGELVGLADDDLSRVLADTFGDDEQRARALAAVGAVTATRLADAAQRADAQERALKTSVDIAQAVTALQDEQLDRINPAIVEAFLHRAAAGGAVTVRPHAAGDGMFTLSRADGQPLPKEFAPPGERRAGTTALVASSGKSLAQARAGERAHHLIEGEQHVQGRPSRKPSTSGLATRRTRPSSHYAPMPSPRPCTGAARSSTRPAAPTTTCSHTRPTSPRQADCARAPGRA